VDTGPDRIPEDATSVEGLAHPAFRAAT
jgi:hypothetical protein